ncbi:uncharacterized protein SAPINGB_P001196 [Magnusiomyces paraingens]|uniref:SET domain-containing protein n=1 Tax=Magnusiomyces paraingens TaxID=2606893 RepID=A0A5E8BAR3_9ASCO|nr:uncharacterized protein SAPINGB_P001196 [Saprochaete ingens]VVT46403.1 unnamed protein product [Saprochaete ingens]
MDGNTTVLPTKPFDRSVKLASLADWAKENGIELNNCEIKAEGSDGAGLYATADITADSKTPIVRVPLDSVLTRRSIFALAEKSEFFKDLLYRKADGTPITVASGSSPTTNEFFEKFPLTSKDILVRFFIYEILTSRRGGPRDRWTSWVESLPPLREMNLPFSWDKDDVESLYGSSIYEAVLSKLEFLKFRYNRLFESVELRERISEYVKAGPQPQINLEADVEVTFQDWLLIESWISSRSLEVLEEPSEEYEENLRLGMVPVVDMCNHDEVGWNSKYELDGETGSVLLIPTREIKRGEEVTITYGENKGAGEMLFSYGFIPAGIKTGHAKVATFAIPPIVDEDDDDEEEEEEEGGDISKNVDEDDDATIVLKAKHRMFGRRARLLQVRQLDASAPVEWESNFVAFLGLPAEYMSFAEVEEDDESDKNGKNGQNGQNGNSEPQILYAGHAFDLGDVRGSLEQVFESGSPEGLAAEANAVSLAESLVRGVFEEGLNERTKMAEAEEEGPARPIRENHVLIELEKQLLAQLQF